MDFPRVLVVGAGQMGGGIAQVLAASGRQRVPARPAARARASGRSRRCRASLARLAAKGGADPAATLARIEAVAELVPADLMIEAVVEDAAVKRDVFAPRRRGCSTREARARVEHELDPDRARSPRRPGVPSG